MAQLFIPWVQHKYSNSDLFIIYFPSFRVLFTKTQYRHVKCYFFTYIIVVNQEYVSVRVLLFSTLYLCVFLYVFPNEICNYYVLILHITTMIYYV